VSGDIIDGADAERPSGIAVVASVALIEGRDRWESIGRLHPVEGAQSRVPLRSEASIALGPVSSRTLS
jgi:hypothetical protein